MFSLDLQHRTEVMSPFQDSLDTLDDFLLRTDSGSLFESRSAELLCDLRWKVLSALKRLLVWGRPELENSRGINWPYDCLVERCRFFETLAGMSQDRFMQKQATLFLALLPFPRQWQWLLQAERQYGDEPELKSFFADELSEISRKIEKKPQRTYKLRHFCQFIKKPVSVREKGILRIFSLPYLFVMHTRLLRRLSQRYVLYVEPPMGIVFRHAWWRYFSQLQDPCVIGIGSREDLKFLGDQPGVFAVPLAHGDFMEDLDWSEDSGIIRQKEYDIVFNATYDDMERKRHGLMLQLLNHPLLLDTTALFLGRGELSNVARFKGMVADAGLTSRITVLANLRRSDVPAQLDRCKVGVHLSLYENACRGIYEFIRSNLPCVIPSCMGGMRPSVFNEETGMAVAEKELPRAISHVIKDRLEFRPREWFIKHSGSANSSRRLNAVLKNYFAARGYDWEEDIVPLGSSGASRYVEAAHYRMFEAEFQWLLELFNSLDEHELKFSIE